MLHLAASLPRKCIFSSVLSAGTSYESVRLFFEPLRLFGFISPLGPSWSKPSETCQTVSWSCQTMGCGRPRLSFSTGPKLPDAPCKPFKRFKPSETFQTGAWSCQLWQAKSFLFFLARNCRMLPSNPPNLPKPAKPSLGDAKLWIRHVEVETP